jgi:hypothetical protein
MIAAGFSCATARIVQYHTLVAAAVDFFMDFDNDPRFGTIFGVRDDWLLAQIGPTPAME